MQILARGEILKDAVGKPNCMQWNITDGHAFMIVHVDGESVERYKLGGHYDFACVPIGNVLFFCVKYGREDWISAPYTPHLSRDWRYVEYESGKGMPLSVCLVRTDDGMIVDMDFMVLGNGFSNAVSCLSAELMRQTFDPRAYDQTIQAVYRQIPTDRELASLTEIRYSID